MACVSFDAAAGLGHSCHVSNSLAGARRDDGRFGVDVSGYHDSELVQAASTKIQSRACWTHRGGTQNWHPARLTAINAEVKTFDLGPADASILPKGRNAAANACIQAGHWEEARREWWVKAAVDHGSRFEASSAVIMDIIILRLGIEGPGYRRSLL